jgi:hypothetical protein
VSIFWSQRGVCGVWVSERSSHAAERHEKFLYRRIFSTHAAATTELGQQGPRA